MTCEEARLALADRLAGQSTPELDLHLDDCASCRVEAGLIETAWSRLGLLEAPEPSSRVRSRFYDMLEQHRRRALPWAWLAAAACLVVGLGIGFLMGRPSREQQEMAAMRTELTGLRQMMAMSLLENPSAADRLRGVSFTVAERQTGDPEVMGVLLDRLAHDPNTNVRLAVVDALEKHAREHAVHQALFEALESQQSPLVQLALIDVVASLRGDASARDALRHVAANSTADTSVRHRAARVLESMENQ